jgi:hypothetical protein
LLSFYDRIEIKFVYLQLKDGGEETTEYSNPPVRKTLSTEKANLVIIKNKQYGRKNEYGRV